MDGWLTRYLNTWRADHPTSAHLGLSHAMCQPVERIKDGFSDRDGVSEASILVPNIRLEYADELAEGDI
jgi:hypothetical protein